MILPVLYVVIGLLLTDLTDYDTGQGDPIRLGAGLYAGEYGGEDRGKEAEVVYTYANRTGELKKLSEKLMEGEKH